MKRDPLAALGVSRETEERLRRFVDLLLKWNSTINLISRRDETQIWDRHVIDSLALLPALPAHASRAIDLGSGGGFPGVVLAIATGWRFDLVEVDQRKAAFLREAIRAAQADATVHCARIETLRIEPAPLLTARALAPLDRLLDLATPFLAPGGICVFPKGRTAEEELTAAEHHWHMQVERIQSPNDPSSTILRIREIARAGS
ncbi:MAG: 16S rRNA (guanine(527)-N(7))-methyltransferase RsmG [Alphaproteobacteria bacterium]|nr:16S rRNA (guanine(527)-N(7))-methyltransferase RsmG [Alphaproteobacteria bacterium]